MEKIISFDRQGRIYLPEELRRYLVFKTFIAKIKDRGLYLEPIEEDPLEELSKLGRGKLKVKSIAQIKKEAREEVKEYAQKKIRRY
ncbi:hypothetical protein J4447_00210 [Candidatus Pacearchaeota archaeon]|nr:hypothetical protein [Candidatus Pacearchaeota archaeon]